MLLVLRGWVADPVDADLPPATGVTVTGTLAPGESPALDVDLANNLMTSVDLGVLINAWDDDLYNAFIFATDESPQVSADSVAEVPPPTLANRDIDWGNLGYALQWWVFAAFAVYMYFRFLHQAAHEDDETSENTDTKHKVRA
ncbi:SURF1 family cytochrome oxidase biogenesis protein [Ornithinimicrobium sp. INDO-MA30-4]|uniref:SURF1 family protein n=1 Tax=Ornithinimicrobium sp. INDO-MA30-4 TaxID=2908651 RepID=UPI0028832427|nr:SURF1 family cytochrome oxidase biogenesis protein [Ornithinimicrobium sp. INDO-MA30-4]